MISHHLDIHTKAVQVCGDQIDSLIHMHTSYREYALIQSVPSYLTPINDRMPAIDMDMALLQTIDPCTIIQ